MASNMKLNVEGFWRRDPPAVIQSRMTGTLHKLSPLISSTVKGETPVDTGGTRDSVAVTVDDKKGTLTLKVGAPKGPQPRFIEWGTVHNKPNPFVKRSFRNLRSTIEAALQAAARRQI